MFNRPKDRGRVMLAVRVVHSPGWKLLWWVVSIVLLVLLCLVALGLLLNPHRWKRPFPELMLLLQYLIYLRVIGDYLFYPRIKFQESGIEIPVNRDYPRMRFTRWNQNRRWSWDGDLLILTGKNFQGWGAVRIPGAEHLAMDQLMGTKLPVR